MSLGSFWNIFPTRMVLVQRLEKLREWLSVTRIRLRTFADLFRQV